MQAGSGLDVTSPQEVQDRIDHGQVRVHDPIEQVQAPDDGHVFRLRHVGHGEGRAQFTRQDATDDVEFLVAGEGDKRGVGADARIDECFLFRRVAAHHQDLVQLRGTRFRPIGVLFKQDGGDGFLLQAPGHIEAKVSPPGHEDLVERLAAGIDPVQQFGQVIGSDGNVDVVPRHEACIAMRETQLALAHHGNKTRFGEKHLGSEIRERGVQKRGVGFCRESGDENTSAEKFDGLQQARMSEDIDHFPRGFLLVADHQVNAKLLEIKSSRTHQSGVGDPGDLVLDAGRMGILAGEDVDFIHVRHGDQQVGLPEFGLLQDVRGRSGSLDGQDVELCFERGQGIRGTVDDHDVMIHLAELRGQVAPGVPGADHENAHRSSFPRVERAERRLLAGERNGKDGWHFGVSGFRCQDEGISKTIFVAIFVLIFVDEDRDKDRDEDENGLSLTPEH